MMEGKSRSGNKVRRRYDDEERESAVDPSRSGE